MHNYEFLLDGFVR